ncbi:MAG: maltose alpha-D-glucosyltransferase [Polyangia bacterium]
MKTDSRRSQRLRLGHTERPLDDDPLWYKDAIIYELHVRAFSDSDGNGIGDFKGLTEKLDYLADLGVTAIWLLPFYPSPLRDDGYDIADYAQVNPSYGTLADVRRLIREAHRRGLRVITELVCNHTSDQHPWFQRARRAKPGSAARNFYVWSDTPELYKDARIIFKDFERSNWTWDPVANAYYWHRFFSHQPDLNFENPQVQRALFKVLDLWFDMGVDGLRLDAVPYLFERDGTSCENLPETHQFLKQLRRHVDEHHQNRMLLAEANQWPDDSVAYFGEGDECHMAFHFPVMPRLFMAMHMEDRFPILDILGQTPKIPESCQWALFLRNHDELTLEMVTDEERDYMYRVYAQDRQARINLGIRRRLAPLLGNHRRKIELMNGLLFSLPGTPVVYYGDELGMGDNIYLGDRNGVRTPMQWSPDRNAGFSSTNPQRLFLPIIIDPEYHYEAINVATQQSNPHSLLWWMKRLIAVRKRYRAFGRGTLTFLHPDNAKVLVFVREHEGERVLVIANLSRFVQAVEIDLSAFQGQIPVEIFGQVPFPPISHRPYFITLGPHSFYWFSLEQPGADAAHFAQAEPPLITLKGEPDWLAVLDDPTLIGSVLPAYIRRSRWFGGKARGIKHVSVASVLPLPFGGEGAAIVLLDVEDSQGVTTTYQLPLACARGERSELARRRWPGCVLCRIDFGAESTEAGVLYEPLPDRAFGKALLELIASRRRIKNDGDELLINTSRALRTLLSDSKAPLEPTVLNSEQSNTSMIFGGKFLLKLVRRVEPGLHPDVEIGRFLTERHPFPHTPTLLGTFEYVRGGSEPVVLGVMHRFVENEGDAWRYTKDVLGRYFESILAGEPKAAPELDLSVSGLLQLAQQEPPREARDTIGAYLESARLLGQRTAELHLALAADPDDPAFAPEAFTPFYQRSIYQSMRNHVTKAMETLRATHDGLPPEVQALAHKLFEREAVLQQRFQAVYERRMVTTRIRHHGDYHLGQVLYTGKDFLIIDFEGEPMRPLSERAIKRSPLRDVAGMMRSFDYATQAARFDQRSRITTRPIDESLVRGWGRYFYGWSSAVFLHAYLDTAGAASFVPAAREDLETLLGAFLLEKALYEVGYELNHRPDWVAIPLDGVLQLLDTRR